MSYRCESKKNIQLNQIVKIQTAKKATHASIYGHHFACDQSDRFLPLKAIHGLPVASVLRCEQDKYYKTQQAPPYPPPPVP